MNRIILVTFTITLCLSVDYYHITGDAKTLKGYTGQAVQAQSPFSRAFQLRVSWQEDSKYVKFQPNQLQLKQTGRMFLDSKAKSLLQSLRTPYADQFRQILVFEDYVLLLKDMNEVVIINDTQAGLTKAATFTIKEIHPGVLVYKAYRFREKALLFSSEQVYILSQKGYYTVIQYHNENRGMVAHVEWIQGTDYILVAEYDNGLAIYQVDEQNSKLKLVRMLDAKFFKQEMVSIEDVNIRHRTDKKLYVLDRMNGVYELQFDLNLDHVAFGRVLIAQQNCNSMDTLQPDYFVMTCGYESENFISELVINQNKSVTVLKPIFKQEFVVDVEVTDDYYLTLSRKIIDVYWNTRKHHLPEQFRSSKSIIITGTQLISLHQKNTTQLLYVITNNQLIRFSLTQIPPKIQLKSDHPLDRNFTLQIYGSCSTIDTTLYTKPLQTDKELCVYTTEYSFKVTEPSRAEKSDVSASISIIIIMLVVLLMLIWICLKKYRKLESQARRMLNQFKSRHYSSRQSYGL